MNDVKNNDPYAIVEIGGKQYTVRENDIIDVDLAKTMEEGEIAFDRILFYNDGTKVHLGAPYVAACSVKGEIMERVKGRKVIVMSFKRRKNYRKKRGHRQNRARIRISGITPAKG